MNKQPSDAGSQSPAGVVFEPITRTDGLPNKVRSQLLQMIAAGQLAPGDRLKPERELASELEVSRNVVREAIRSLVDANVLESRQGAGVFVASLHVESLIEPLELVLALEKATLHSLAQARLAIEPGIAALAAQHASDEDLAALEALIEESGASAPEDSEGLRAIDIELHARVGPDDRQPVPGPDHGEHRPARAQQPRLHQLDAPDAHRSACGPRADRRRPAGARPRGCTGGDGRPPEAR